MPVTLTYPGIYVQELESDVHTITGVATSITAFVGRTLRGPTDRPMLVLSFADFTRLYGDMSRDSTVSYAVQQFFQNGGSQAVIARVHKNAMAATYSFANGTALAAANEGTWGGQLRLCVDYNTRDPSDTTLFNLFVQDASTGATESFRNVSLDTTDPRYLRTVLQQQSQLIRVTTDGSMRPPATAAAPAGTDPYSDPTYYVAFNNDGSDGSKIGALDVFAPALEKTHDGLWLLDKTDIFNLLCIPPYTFDDGDDVQSTDWNKAFIYASRRRAFVIADAPSSWNQPSTIDSTNVDGAFGNDDTNAYAAGYYPRLLIPDPLQENRLHSFAPCGVVAGIYARTDTQRGVWKAPAGIEATLSGVAAITINGNDPANLSDGENGVINPLGVNCLRSFPTAGRVVWGSRTLRGSDALANQWKYVPVRRLANYIEESLLRGTQWVVFEPNDEPLWSQIRLNVGDFMQTLFRQGAFQGRTRDEAYLVKCNSETTTQSDIDRGIVNILVGFAPLKPAEFVVISIKQLTARAS